MNFNVLSRYRTWKHARQQRAAFRSLTAAGRIAGGGWVPAAPVLSGTYVTPETALSLAAVYAAVNVISRDLASLPCNVYRRLPGGGREIAPEMPQHELVHTSPDGVRDACRFFQAIMGHVLTRGNGYAEIVRDKFDGRPVALHLLHPSKTKAKYTESADGEDRHLYYEVNGDADNRALPENVLHFAGMGFDGLTGFAPVTVCRQTIGLGIAVEQFGASFFGNGAILRGILKTAKKLSAIAADNLRRTFNSIHQGSQAAHQVAVLEEGLEWQNAGGVSPEDAQFLETRKFQVVDIARIFSVPPHKIGDYSQAHLANVEEANLDYIATTLCGWVVMIEAQLNSKLLTAADRQTYEIGLDMSALMRGNTAARTAYYQAMRNMGCLSADRILAMEGLNPIGAEKGGDKYIVQSQYIPLDQVGKQPVSKPAAQPAEKAA